MGKWLKRDKLPKRPLVLCTWYSGGQWRKYERLANTTDPEAAIEETRECCIWSSNPTFQMVIVDYQ